MAKAIMINVTTHQEVVAHTQSKMIKKKIKKWQALAHRYYSNTANVSIKIQNFWQYSKIFFTYLRTPQFLVKPLLIFLWKKTLF